MPHLVAIYESVFHSLEAQIAVIDRTGNIITVNLAWQKFGTENGLSASYSCVGINYIETLYDSAASGDRFAKEALQGIQSVLEGKNSTFYYEYPCHSLREKRWFIMRVTPLYGEDSGGLFIISHHNITQRKLAEERVEELVMLDPLTGLGNRRAFNQYLIKGIRNCIRSQTPIGLAIIDVDYFKNYNDEFGHAAGDQCLTKVGQILLAHARRPDDLAARIGGDEFALILPNIDLDNLRKIAESILKKINDLNMVFGDSKQVSVSIGLLSIVPNNHHSGEFLFQETDKALYRAKSAGRNQAVHANLTIN